MHTATPTFPLSMAAEGVCLKVVGIHGGHAFARRVAEIGINPGAEIRIDQRHGGALIIRRGETRYALGGGMAHKIMVCDALAANDTGH